MKVRRMTCVGAPGSRELGSSNAVGKRWGKKHTKGKHANTTSDRPSKTRFAAWLATGSQLTATLAICAALTLVAGCTAPAPEPDPDAWVGTTTTEGDVTAATP